MVITKSWSVQNQKTKGKKYKTVADPTRTKIIGMIRLQGGVSNLCCFRNYKQQNVSFMLQEYIGSL